MLILENKVQEILEYKKCLKASDLEIGKFYVLSENTSGSYLSLSLYMGKNNKEYWFYNIMYLNCVSLGEHDKVKLLSKKQIEFIPDMIKEVMEQKCTYDNIIKIQTLTNRLLYKFDYTFEDIDIWYMKNRFLDNRLVELSKNVNRQSYVSFKQLKEGNFYFNSNYVYYLIAKHDKQHLDVYYWNNYDMYKCLANLSLNDKKTFIKEAFACNGRKKTMKMRSLKAITPDAEAVKLRSLSRLCSY